MRLSLCLKCEIWIWQATVVISIIAQSESWLPCDVLKLFLGCITVQCTVDEAYYCRWNSAVCLSACHNSEPCKNGWTDWDFVWDMDSGGRETMYWMDVTSRSLVEGAILRGGEGTAPIVKFRDTLQWALQKMYEPIEMPCRMWTWVGPTTHVLEGLTLAPPCEHDWGVCLRWRCGLI